ncbi:MAG: hypothetical protein PWP27_195 [Clostridiales bacterium]|jgi:hypothetical protein|nr:hypothetical protein [Clostridiales bacterium]
MVLCDNKKCDFLEPEGFCRLQTTLILNGVCENATDRVGKDVSVDWGKVKEAYKKDYKR